MLSLPRKLEAMSSYTDRSQLPAALLRAMVTLPGDEADMLVFAREPHGETVLTPFSGTAMMNSAVAASLRPVAAEAIARSKAFAAPIARDFDIEALFAGRGRLPASRPLGALSVRR